RAGVASIVRATGNRQDAAALLERVSRGVQGAGPAPRLDDNHAPGKGGDDPVAPQEVVASRLHVRRPFADDGATLVDDAASEVVVLRRVEVTMPTTEDGYGCGRYTRATASSSQRPLVSGAVDAKRQPRHDHHLVADEGGGDAACQFERVARGPARTDDRARADGADLGLERGRQ